MADDPLDAIEHFPVETQVAIIISVLRTTRNQLGRIERKIDWVSRSIWALIATIVAGVVIYYVTVGRHPAPQTNPAGTSVVRPSPVLALKGPGGRIP